jgi:hypothetical protein
MNDDMTPIKDALVGFWILDASGMQSQVALSPNGQYTNTLAGGAQGHSGTWAVSNNTFGGQTIVFTLTASYPKEYVGPLGTVPITWPMSETWYVTGIQPDQILIKGGSLRRITPEMAAAGMSMGAAMTGFPGMMTMADYNAEMEREMRQIGDAGRKVFGALKNIFKKR